MRVLYLPLCLLAALASSHASVASANRPVTRARRALRHPSASVSSPRLATSRRDTPLSHALELRGGEAVTTPLIGSVASLTKNVMGIGILTLAAAVASAGARGATIAMMFVTVIAAYAFSLVGTTCELTGLGAGCTFEGLWSSTLGAASTWMVHAIVITFTFPVLIVCYLCLCDLLQPLLALLAPPNLKKALSGRRPSLLLSYAIVTPLCLLSLARLSAVSGLGMAAVLYTVGFSIMRWLDGSYAKGGRLHELMPAEKRPAFAPSDPPVFSATTAAMFANLGIAFCAHFNAPGFYRSLEAATPARFLLMSYLAFACIFSLSWVIAISGYKTFGLNCDPLVLNNYHPTADAYATASRAATAASLFTTFPLVFNALRESTLATWARVAPASGAAPNAWWIVTCSLPTLAVILADRVTDLGLLVGLIGSLMGGAITYVTPSLMHAAWLLNSPLSPAAGQRERLVRSAQLAVDFFLLAYGLLVQMGLGTLFTWQAGASRRKAKED